MKNLCFFTFNFYIPLQPVERIKRGAWSRLRKVEFNLRQISFIMIDDSVMAKCGSFQKDFRNANGNPRNEKVLLDLEKLDEKNIFFLDFQSRFSK
ncbi:hypothetical protein MSIBF_A2560004 [groundwater metagenome]|uniref:Uncharacterized protein n=1 Tax=groundwater metagenome TaxID=717931 RepID=A0A098EAU4_9ZZZZ